MLQQVVFVAVVFVVVVFAVLVSVILVSDDKTMLLLALLRHQLLQVNRRSCIFC